MQADITQTTGYLIHEVSRLINRAYDKRMSELGLTRAQWWVLAKLHVHNGVTQSELAIELGFTKAAVGLLLDRLESKGWLKRKVQPSDRRARCVYRTAKAASLIERMQNIAIDMNRDIEAGLSKSERSALHAALAKVRANLAKIE